MGFTSHRGFESRPLRSLRSATRPSQDGRYARSRLAPVAQLDRASVYGTEGHRFESCRARFRKALHSGLLHWLHVRRTPNFVPNLSREPPNPGLGFGPCGSSNRPPAMSSGARVCAARPGTPSTACRTVVRSRSASGRRGQNAAGPRPATLRSAPLRTGCAACSTRRGAARCPASCGPARRADAAAEFLRYVEHDRAIKPSTLTDYRSIVAAHLVPTFGAMRVEE